MAQGSSGDRSAEADPLPTLRQWLMDEFGGSESAEMIDRVARQSLNDLGNARVPDFVPMFAWRRARIQLRGRADRRTDREHPMTTGQTDLGHRYDPLST
jgi:hypothetical protein